jgi:methylmalonyl-CoA mutase cobalamin-binding domain/chain
VVDAIVGGDIAGVEAAGKAALDAVIDPEVILQEGGSEGLDIVGRGFECLEMFLPELVGASEAMKALTKMVLPRLKATGVSKKRESAVVVFGTVYGDVHDMGKNLAATQLSLHGYEVHDLGINVPVKDFLKAAEEKKAKIIAMSSLLTTSSYYQQDMVVHLKKVGQRDKYYVIVGGGIVTEDWAEKIGADGYGRVATDAVTLCDMLLEKSPRPGTGTIKVYHGSVREHGTVKTFYHEVK